MHKKNLLIFLVWAGIVACGSPLPAAGKEAAFPLRPIRFIVPDPAGSENDVRNRRLVPFVEKHLGGPIVLHSRPGAEGRLAMNDAWQAAPDGYTIVSAGLPGPLINEKLFPVNYKTREFSHIFAWSRDNNCVVVKGDAFKNPRDFLEEARERTLTAGIVGFGNLSEIAGLSLADAAGFQPVHWRPFKSPTEIITGLTGDHIDFAVTTVSSAKNMVEGGRLKVAFVIAREKDPLFPQAPLPKDLGFHLTAMPVVHGALAPPGLPPAIAGKLAQAFAGAVSEPDFVTWAKRAGLDLVPLDRGQFLNYTAGMEKEILKYLNKMEIKR